VQILYLPIMTPNTAAPPQTPTQGGFSQKFGEILLVCFIPGGLLQFVPPIDRWVFSTINKTPHLLSTLAGMLLLSGGLAWFWQKRKGGERLHGVFQTLRKLPGPKKAV